MYTSTINTRYIFVYFVLKTNIYQKTKYLYYTHFIFINNKLLHSMEGGEEGRGRPKMRLIDIIDNDMKIILV